LVGNKVQLPNEIRGIFNEYGIIAAKGDSALKKKIIEIIDRNYESSEWEEISDFLRSKAQELYEELIQLELKIDQKDTEISTFCKSDETVKRLMKVPGIGPITASALVAHVGNAKTFTSGRQFAAYFGLVPREHSTGGKTRLLGISKRGDSQIRSLLIHGARALIAGVRYVKKERYDDWMQERSRQLRWAHTLLENKGMNKTAVALANKHARIAWAILAKDIDYDPQHKSVRTKKIA
jgi:transposase